MLYYEECKLIENNNIIKNIIIVNNKSNKIQVGRYYKFYYPNGTLKTEQYYINNKLHNPNGPAIIWYYENETLETEGHYIDGECHNPNGPAFKHYYKDGTLEAEQYYINDKYLSKKEFEERKK